MYKVYHFQSFNPAGLEKWLNDLYNREGLELVAVNNNYFIFRQLLVWTD